MSIVTDNVQLSLGNLMKVWKEIQCHNLIAIKVSKLPAESGNTFIDAFRLDLTLIKFINVKKTHFLCATDIDLVMCNWVTIDFNKLYATMILRRWHFQHHQYDDKHFIYRISLEIEVLSLENLLSTTYLTSGNITLDLID